MHELAIACSMVELALDQAQRAGLNHVTRVHCRIGTLRQIEEDMMRTAFVAAREGTACCDAELLIENVPMQARCPRCCQSFAVEDWNWVCPRCQVEGELLDGGDELELVSIEAENVP